MRPPHAGDTDQDDRGDGALETQNLEAIRKGLRTAAPPDPARLEREVAELERLEHAPAPQRWWGFLKRGGPGYLQAAMTLGGGTAASAIFAGRLFGYQLLWVAPVGMLLGVVMMNALAHQTLSTGMRPFEAMRRYAGAPLAWAWALGALVASIVWHFPQYSLAGASLADIATVAGFEVSAQAAAFAVLAAAVVMSLMYGRNDRALRLYEGAIKAIVACVVVAFAVVVIASAGRTDWGAVARGFVPSIPEARGGTRGMTLIASGLAAAVGINMVFLYPYTLLARGWGRAHRTLARFDLGAGMLVPYTLATSFVVIAIANTIPWDPASGEGARLQSVDAARSIGSVLGETRGRVLFDLGLFAMAFSTITLHMVCAGFVIMELTGAAFGSLRWRVGMLLPAVGVLGPMVGEDLSFWLAIPTSIFCGLLLPVAYFGIVRLQASRAYLGPDRPSGVRAVLVLVLMIGITVFLATVFIRDLSVEGPKYVEKLRSSTAAPR